MSTLADLEKALEKVRGGSIPPLVLIHGDQRYLVKQAYDRLLEAVVPEDLRAFNLEQLDGARIEVSALMDAFDIVPMMQGPKALGVPEARFFSGKADTGELLQRGADAWVQGDANAALRILGRVLAMAAWTWEDGASKGLDELAAALDCDLPDAGPGQEALKRALEQGAKSDFPLPLGGDEGGVLAERLEATLAAENASSQRCLIFSCPVADARKRLFKLVQAKGLVLEFKAEKKGAQASQTASVFLRNLLAQRGLTAPMATAQRLVSAYGDDLGLLVAEVDKLEAYAYPQKQITDKAVDEVGSPRMEDRIFELLGHLGKKELGPALIVLNRLLELEHPMMLFASLAKEVRLLLLWKALMDEGRVPGRGNPDYYSYKSAVHPKLGQDLPAGLASYFKKTHAFICFQGMQRARSMDAASLRAMLAAFLRADLALKSSGADPRAKLEELCMLLAGVEEEVLA